LAAAQIASDKAMTAKVEASDWQGSITGTMNKNSNTGEFTIRGTGHATGVVEVQATVDVFGIVVGSDVRINYTHHSQ
ncbi:MAG TPA: hypothetical protein VFV49_13090, partial [Thermoanaerobaculia bacterium]|nr:hypothetical protein [Thermoanaerobaculia bacterium]